MTDLQKHANELWQARINGTQCPYPSQPRTLADAYALQHATTKASGQTISGYKIGATSEETLGILNLAEPFYGAMFNAYTSYTKPNETLELALPKIHNPRVEAEFIACLKNSVKRGGKDIELDELFEHIDWVAPGFEFVGSRYTPTDGSPGTSVIGDFGAHQHSVIGQPDKNWKNLDLTTHAASLSINAEEVITGHSGMSIHGHPLAFVCWLLNHPDMADGLQAGQIISCGTVSGAVAVSAGDLVQADYGSLGTLSVKVGPSLVTS